MPSVRTIFLFLRGIDQTGRAMEGAKKGLMTLEERQEALRHSTYRLLFGTAAFAIFGVMMAKVIAGLIETTSRGTLILDDFGNAWGRLAAKMGESLVKIWAPTLHWVTDLMDSMAGNEITANILSLALSFATAGVALLAFKNILMLMKSQLIIPIGTMIWNILPAAIATPLAGIAAALTGAAGVLWAAGGVTGVLEIAFAAFVTFKVLEAAWEWATGTPESRLEMQLRAGREAPTPLTGATGYAVGFTPNLQNIGISIDMSNSLFGVGLTPEELAVAIARRMSDELTNRGIMNIP